MNSEKQRTPKPHNPDIYRRLEEALKAIPGAFKTQPDRAREWNVSPTAVAAWEKGTVDIRASAVVLECTRHGLDMYEIYTGNPSPPLLKAQETIKRLEQELAEARQELAEARRVPAALARFEQWLDKQERPRTTDVPGKNLTPDSPGRTFPS